MKGKIFLVGFLMLCVSSSALGQTVNESMAESALEGAEEDIVFMRDNGVPVNQARYLLQQAEKAHRRARLAERLETGDNISDDIREELERIDVEDSNFSQVLEFTGRISDLRGSTVMLRDELVALNYGVEDAYEKGADVEEVRRLLKESWSLFYDEQFSEADVRAGRTRSELENALSENTTLNLFFFLDRGFFTTYGVQIFVFLLFVSPGLLMTLLVYRYLHLRERIGELRSERRVLEELIEDVQKGYFVEKSVSRSVYDSRIEVYQERFERVESSLDVLESRYDRLSKYVWFK